MRLWNRLSTTNHHSERRRSSRSRWPNPFRIEAEVLEDRSLLTAPMVISPIEDLTVSQDQVERVAAGLDSPLYVTAPPNDFDRLFIVEKTGQIRILDLNSGQVLPTPFLDLPDSNLTTNGERGLLGLVFHPDYASNGLFFVNFTDVNGNTVIARHEVSAGDPNVADPSAVIVLTLTQPESNHNGGWMGFGPDGFLYISSGDGGGANDPNDLAQNLEDLHGKILRIDVDGDDFMGDPNRNYAIPADNPFVGIVGDDEIWAYGLRNPWRPSFDRLTGDFYIADVGQGAREEVNFQRADSPGGENYGWRLREGTIATPGDVGGPRPPGAVDPVYEYTHGTGQFQGRSVTGGYVYRGPIEDFQGQYIFGDFISRQIWSIEVDRDAQALVPNSLMDLTQAFRPDLGSIDLISSFGEDAAGNLYIVDLGGEVFRVVPRFTNTYVIDLSQVFSDPEEDDTYMIETNTDPDAVVAEITGTTLRLSFQSVTPVDVEITVRASDPGGMFATDTFLVDFNAPSAVVVGADIGGGPHVRTFDAETQRDRLSFFAYDPGFRGGVRVASGDLNGDGIPEVITAPGPGGGPHVRVFNGLTGQPLAAPVGGFFAYNPAFTSGIMVAAADIDRDGITDIITAPDAGGGPHIRVFSGADGSVMNEFFAFDPGFRGGVRIAVGDVDGNGTPDIIAAAGPGGGPHVRIFNGETGVQIAGLLGSFFAYDPGFRGGVYVSAALLDGDNRAEVITSPGAGGGPHVKIFRGSDASVIGSFFAFESSFTGGVRIGASNVTNDGEWLIFAAAGSGGDPSVRIFDGEQLAQGSPPETAQTADFEVFGTTFRGGIFVGGPILTMEPAMGGTLAAVFADPEALLGSLV